MPRFSLGHLRRPFLLLLGLAAMAGLLAWLMGVFHARVPAGPPVQHEVQAPAGPRHLVQSVRTLRTETAVGTVRAVREALVASRILGRVKTLAITRAGQPVQQGELLAELDASDLQAAAQQARAALDAAKTRRDQTKLDFERSQTLAQQGIAAPAKLDADRAAFEAATAEVARAEQAVLGADSMLGFATITAPLGGIVVDKQVNQGDVVAPGQPICTIYDPTQLQLVATVREELAGKLRIGQAVEVTLEALGKSCQGVVAEIVPAAQAVSRAFEVKVTGPCQPGIVTGMFGRLHVPVGEVEELRVPRAAIASAGQLDFVHVVAADGAMVRRFVRLGRAAGDDVQVLSGLAAGETVLGNAVR